MPEFTRRAGMQIQLLIQNLGLSPCGGIFFESFPKYLPVHRGYIDSVFFRLLLFEGEKQLSQGILRLYSMCWRLFVWIFNDY